MPFIELTKSGLSQYVNGRTQGYRMTVQATKASDGIPNEIFVFQRVPSGATYADTFTNIASPADIQEYPSGAPGTDSPFFRLSSVDLVFRNIALSEDAWTGIKNDVAELIQTLEFFENMEVQEVVDFGSSSSSSSSSA